MSDAQSNNEFIGRTADELRGIRTKTQLDLDELNALPDDKKLSPEVQKRRTELTLKLGRIQLAMPRS